jgi:thiamine biosynthesis protein ThiS
MGELLDMLEIPKTKVAVELNGAVIPNSELLGKVLKDKDILEIVRAIGGG